MRVGFFATITVLAVVFVQPTLCCTTDSDILIDIIFVVDGSGSIGTKNFELVKLWLVNATTTMFRQFGQRAQFQVLEYSNKDPIYKNIPIAKSTVFEIPFRLGDCKTVSCMTSRIMSMEYLQSQTYTYYALNRVIEVEFPLSAHYSTAKKAIILLTDGTANDGVFLHQAYDKCVQEDITNFAIGVGNYQLRQLRVFANGGNTNERVFTSTNFESLSSVMDSLDRDLTRAGFFCDECTSGTHDCHVQAECINRADGFECKCKEGYYGNGKECKQINYCADNPCQRENMRCISENLDYDCICIDGFEDVGGSCLNVDDCASNPCPGDGAVCEDLVKGFMCSCEEGMKWDGSACIARADNNPSMIITMITLIAALVSFLVIVGVVAYFTCPRGRKFTVAGNDDDDEGVEMMTSQRRRV